MIPSEWMTGIVAREIPESRRAEIVDTFSALDESIFENQDLDRMAAAILILFIEGVDLDVIIDGARSDWRDLLVGAGLENADWPAVVAERFGSSP
jgi:hypothetical protein